MLRASIPQGLFVPVSPGTRFVTVGGAIASDIHGKNHHVDGTFGSHVRALTLLLADGSTVDIGPDRRPELFWATVGGMGLTGVVLEATISMLPIETSQMTVDTERADDLDDLLDLMTSGDAGYRYSVAWIDLLARGPALGRSVLTRGDHARVEELAPERAVRPLAYRPGHLATVPALVPGRGLLNHTTIAGVQRGVVPGRTTPARSARSSRSRGSSIRSTRSARGTACTGGAVSCSTSSSSRSAQEEALRRVVTRLAERGTPSFLSVLKRFGAANPAPLSFPAPGWTLTLDIPAERRRSRRAARRARRRRARAPAGGTIWPRTPSPLPKRSAAAIRASPSGRRSATPSIRRAAGRAIRAAACSSPARRRWRS